MTRVALLQARTNSARLPAKVLLPVAGIPLTVLAARRAGNTGIPVIVATSSASSDDELASVCHDNQLDVFRGSLSDPLERMTAALEGWPDETVVIRLTADNAVPDGALLDAMTAEFEQQDNQHLICGGPGSGLPYGVSAEVLRLKSLRAAAAQAVTPYDREHVTPWVRREFGSDLFTRYAGREMTQLRCTIDCRDDYELMTRVFRAVPDAVSASLDELLTALSAHWPYPLSGATNARKLVLGTAQLGMPYGIGNRTGMPDAEAAAGIIKTALAAGVEWLDTARAYGASEQVIGASLVDGWQGRARIITKLSLDLEGAARATAEHARACVDASVFQSTTALGQNQLQVVMLHRAEHLHAWDGAVLQRLRELVAGGTIGQIGVSVQNPAELLAALEHSEVEVVQLPFNLLDWRWQPHIEQLEAARRERTLIVHARSALLQGLLLSNDPTSWAAARCPQHASVRAWLSTKAAAYRQGSITSLALGYARSMDWIDGVVVGVELLEQLHANLRHFADAPLTHEEILDLQNSRPQVDIATLDPAQWEPL